MRLAACDLRAGADQRHPVRRVPAAMIFGIAATTLLALATGQTAWRPAHAGIADLQQTAFHLDFPSFLGLGCSR